MTLEAGARIEGPLASTRLFALLGSPVAHSLSPVIQNAGFRSAGLDGVYAALECAPEDLHGIMRALARAGGGGNVTLPHKERAATVLDEAGETVRRTGACNTFWGEGGRIRGENTDVEGVKRAVRALLDGPPFGARVLMIGGGGGARAALAALIDEGVADVSVVNRTTVKGRAMARRIGDERVHVKEDVRAVAGEGFDLVVNATSLGLHVDDALPVELDRLGPVGAVMDMVYAPAGTRFAAVAGDRGIHSMDGAEMLLQQGAVAFEFWWNQEAPLAAMREALARVRRE